MRKIGNLVGWDKLQRSPTTREPLQEMFDRCLEHPKAHQIDPGQSILGPWLECDAAGEYIKDNPQATGIARGFCRPPFTLPETKIQGQRG